MEEKSKDNTPALEPWKGPIIRKFEDEQPIFTYRGRRFEIESGGLACNTKIKIDGKEQNNIVSFVISIPNPDSIVIIKMETRDLE